MRQMKNKKERGITLIALVVTIIVLIILAGISINLIFGTNGIINKAKDAKIKTDIASIKENIQMEILGKQLSSEDFAQKINEISMSGISELVFIIGSSCGFIFLSSYDYIIA